jgi:hypothetical protein
MTSKRRYTRIGYFSHFLYYVFICVEFYFHASYTSSWNGDVSQGKFYLCLASDKKSNIQSGHKVPYQLRVTNLQDLKAAVGDCFYDIQPSTWKKVSERTRNRIKQCAEKGRQHTDML